LYQLFLQNATLNFHFSDDLHFLAPLP
jgi:hypothetical protein